MPKHSGPAKKPGFKDEMLLYLMKVRLDTPCKIWQINLKLAFLLPFFFFFLRHG